MANLQILRAMKLKLEKNQSNLAKVESISRSIEQMENLLGTMEISDSMHPVKILGLECSSALLGSVVSTLFAYFGYIYSASNQNKKYGGL